MTAINRAPTGWLGFLGIKNFGRNPETTADVLAPVWDLSTLYLAANRRWVAAAATITGVGAYPTGQVPPGKVWAMESYGVITSTLAAGNALNFQLMHYFGPLAIPIPLGGTQPSIAPAVGGVGMLGLTRPIILPPGESLGFYVNQFAGANIPANVFLCYTEMDA